MAKKSPTQRTLEWLRENGWVSTIVEKWNPYAHIRQDAYGFGDILACHPLQVSIALVQCTSAGNVAARRTKILAEPRAEQWIMAGGSILLIGWGKYGAHGKRKLWTPRWEWIRETDFP